MLTQLTYNTPGSGRLCQICIDETSADDWNSALLISHSVSPPVGRKKALLHDAVQRAVKC